MDDPVNVVMFSVLGLIALAVVAMVVISAVRLAERARDLRAWAKHEGFSYVAREKLPNDLRALPFFQRGVQFFGRRIKNVMRGHRHDVELLVFDTSYLETSGTAAPTSRTTRATVVCLRKKGSSAWSVFPAADLQYLPVPALRGFLEESLHEWKHHPVPPRG